jgi:hypothetical protein
MHASGRCTGQPERMPQAARQAGFPYTARRRSAGASGAGLPDPPPQSVIANGASFAVHGSSRVQYSMSNAVYCLPRAASAGQPARTASATPGNPGAGTAAKKPGRWQSDGVVLAVGSMAQFMVIVGAEAAATQTNHDALAVRASDALGKLGVDGA